MAGLLNEKEQGCCFLISAPGPPLPLRPHRHGLLTDVHFDEWSKAFQGGTAVGLRDPEPATRVLRLQQSGTVPTDAVLSRDPSAGGTTEAGRIASSAWDPPQTDTFSCSPPCCDRESAGVPQGVVTH